MKRFIVNSILTIFSILLYSADICYPLSVETHSDINEYIARNNLNGFSLGTYLKSNLGIDNGITTSYNSREVWQLLRDGGEYEDAPPENTIPYRRSRNHFHNPLLPWDQAYYTDQYAFCSWTDNPFFISGHCPVSAILWAQGPQNSDFVSILGVSTDLNPGGDWSWPKVREYFYTAMTGMDYSGNIVAADKTQRDTYFAKTFRGLGHLMHLVQDMSVPEHTRNKVHLLEMGDCYA